MEQKVEKLKLQWIPTLVLCIYPLLLIVLSVIFLVNCEFKMSYLWLAIVTYYCANISIGIGVHRLWSHNSYKTKTWIEVILALISAGTLQGPIIAWASDHYRHHTHTDKEQDPHSPLQYKNKFIGFLWSHIGWMMFSKDNIKSIDKVALKKLATNKVIMWQYRNYWTIAIIMNAVVPPTIGFLIFGSIKGAIAAFIFMGLARAFQQHMTFCVNSFSHFVGSRPYVDNTSRDSWWLFPFLLGENWHNFHHAFARDYRNGVKWYHPDVHKWIIALLEKLGLAYDLVRTPKERIEAKVSETSKNIAIDAQQGLESILVKVSDIAALVRTKIELYEKNALISAKEASLQMKTKLLELEEFSTRVSSYIKSLLKDYECNFEIALKNVRKSVEHLENSAKRLGVSLNVASKSSNSGA